MCFYIKVPHCHEKPPHITAPHRVTTSVKCVFIYRLFSLIPVNILRVRIVSDSRFGDLNPLETCGTIKIVPRLVRSKYHCLDPFEIVFFEHGTGRLEQFGANASIPMIRIDVETEDSSSHSFLITPYAV